MDKVLQIRLSEGEYDKIKRAFIGTNISNLVRTYLLQQAEEILQDWEVEEIDDFEKFKIYMRNEETLKELYENFKTRAQNRKYEVRGGDTMARNLKYQFKYAIEQSFKPGADKHSMKSNRAEDGSRGSKTLM